MKYLFNNAFLGSFFYSIALGKKSGYLGTSFFFFFFFPWSLWMSLLDTIICIEGYWEERMAVLGASHPLWVPEAHIYRENYMKRNSICPSNC